jgi:hypothetical protein
MDDCHLAYGMLPPMFHSTSKNYLEEKRLELKIPLIIDNAPGYHGSVCYENEISIP